MSPTTEATVPYHRKYSLLAPVESTSTCRVFFFSSRRRHTRLQGDWSSDVCSSDLAGPPRRSRRRWVPRPAPPRRRHRSPRRPLLHRRCAPVDPQREEDLSLLLGRVHHLEAALLLPPVVHGALVGTVDADGEVVAAVEQRHRGEGEHDLARALKPADGLTF